MRKPSDAKIPCLRALELNGKSSQFLALAVVNYDYFREIKKHWNNAVYFKKEIATKGGIEMSLLSW